MSHRSLGVAAFTIAIASASAARADDEPQVVPADRGPIMVPRGPIPYARVIGSVLGGTGLRFNNPYRLATPLGRGGDAESLSRTAAYVDLGVSALFGVPAGFQHGPGLRLSLAVEGVHQEVFAPSYVVCRQWRAFQPCARFGVPIVLRPDTNVGVELGAGLTYFVRAGLGVVAEGIGSLFYGAGTREAAYPAYPIVSGQAGLVVSYEVLP